MAGCTYFVSFDAVPADFDSAEGTHSRHRSRRVPTARAGGNKLYPFRAIKIEAKLISSILSPKT